MASATSPPAVTATAVVVAPRTGAAAAVDEDATSGVVLYGAHFCLRASRRSFFCCIIRRRLSSLDLVLEFSNSTALIAAAQRWQCCCCWVDEEAVGVSGWPHLHSVFGAAFEWCWQRTKVEDVVAPSVLLLPNGVGGTDGLQPLQLLLPLLLLAGPMLAMVLVAPLLGYFLVWIEAGTHRDTKRGLGAATGVVRVAGAIRAAACRLLALLLLFLLLLEAPPLDAFAAAAAVTWFVATAAVAELVDGEGSK